MNILLTGASGLIGSHFLKQFYQHNNFTLLSRFPEKLTSQWPNSHVINSLDKLTDLNNFDAVINLAGEPIAEKRWTQAQKDSIYQSRLSITQKLSDLIIASTSPPTTFISGSAIGFYGRQTVANIDENYQDVFDEFSHKLCLDWENAALSCSVKTRVCLLRTGIVLDKQQGALAKMITPFKFGVGTVLGSGDQVMSWIHKQDMVNAIHFILTNVNLSGPINMTAPNPATNKEFSETLAKVLHRPCLFKTPAAVLRLMLGEMSDLLLYGQHVTPNKLLEANFQFTFPELELALNDLL